jgi:probable lipoprotein (TIGR04455 family)
MARNYVNLKRDFIAKDTKAMPLPQDKPFAPLSQCGEGLEAVLWLAPTVADQGSDVHESLLGKLVRCGDGVELWSAQAEGTWHRVDTSLSEMSANYVKDFGTSVEPYIAPAFHLLKPTLDTLPNPKLTDQEQVEKTEND